MLPRILLITCMALLLLTLPAVTQTQQQTAPTQAAPPQAAPPQAAPAAPAVIGPAKIAFFNLEAAVLSCEDGKRDFAEMQKYVDKKNSEMESLRKELDTLRNTLQIQGSKLTEEALADLQDQIETKDTNLQRYQQDTQKDIDARRSRITNNLTRKFLPVVEKLAKEKGLSAVMIISQANAYIDPSLIVTDQIIKAYNQAHPAAAAPSAPAKKP